MYSQKWDPGFLAEIERKVESWWSYVTGFSVYDRGSNMDRQYSKLGKALSEHWSSLGWAAQGWQPPQMPSSLKFRRLPSLGLGSEKPPWEPPINTHTGDTQGKHIQRGQNWNRSGDIATSRLGSTGSWSSVDCNPPCALGRSSNAFRASVSSL